MDLRCFFFLSVNRLKYKNRKFLVFVVKFLKSFTNIKFQHMMENIKFWGLWCWARLGVDISNVRLVWGWFGWIGLVWLLVCEVGLDWVMIYPPSVSDHWPPPPPPNIPIRTNQTFWGHLELGRTILFSEQKRRQLLFYQMFATVLAGS